MAIPNTPKRYLIYFLFGLCFVISYIDRSVLSIAIIPLTEELHYSSTQKGFILGAFYYGYISTQIVAGIASKRFGSHKVLGTMVFIWSIFTGLTAPSAPYLSLLIISRIMVGIAEGFGHPATMHAITHWSPYYERSSVVSIVFGCNYLGNVLAMLVTPFLIELLGWRMVFYLSGLLGVMWVILWLIIGSDSPSKNRFISKEEAEYIEQNLIDPSLSLQQHGQHEIVGARLNAKSEEKVRLTESENVTLTVFKTSDPPITKKSEKETLIEHNNEKAEKVESDDIITLLKTTPWKSLLSSLQVWAIFVAHFGTNYGGYILQNWMPTYLNSVYGVPYSELALLTTLPYVCVVVFSIVAGLIADKLREREMKVKNIRKIMNGIGLLGPGFCTLVLASWTFFSEISVSIAALILVFAFSMISFVHAGFESNFIDISPKYAGIIFSISNTFGTLPGIIGVPLAGIMVNVSSYGYNITFLSAAIVYFMCGAFNIKFGGPH
eukprot:TRINITY_DN5659_c0_g1_i1.p1 TRINITY_DN5659_c0_g1~~TRINITY_DN5659_c0_g1_i1.p1  ORF type:complete len:493 (-),score=60.14 TRINITY_DN5659_c0_g1_i1:52-1530(-)